MHSLFSASDDKDIRVWDANTGLCRNVLKGHTGEVNSVCVSPNSSGSMERLAKFETGSGGETVNVQEEIYALQNLKSVDATEIEWPHTKIMLLGRGRAGKTSLSLHMMGRPQQSVASTRGHARFDCRIFQTSVKNEASSTLSKPWQEVKVSSDDSEFEYSMSRAFAKEMAKSSSSSSSSSANQGRLEILPSGEAVEVVKGADLEYEEIKRIENDAASSIASGSVVPNKSSPSKSTSNSKTGGGSSSTVAPTAVNAARQTISPVVDDNFITKCLSNDVYSSSKFVVSLYDFGGQEVFNAIHPFYLTRFGIYVVVFDMEEMLSEDEKIRNECIASLSFWVNSVVVHSLSIIRTEDGHESQVTAPVAFVGTRKDKVPRPADHERISTMLNSLFSKSLIFSNILKNNAGEGRSGANILLFFPVCCNSSEVDPTIASLMKTIERRIEMSDYIHMKKPASWIKTLDSLRSSKTFKDYYMYPEVDAVAASHGVDSADLPNLLRFLHEMGMLMWHEDSFLRDVVVMDPTNFFVAPSTLVICKHSPTEDDPIFHSAPIHDKARLYFNDDFDVMVSKGVVSERLLLLLLEDSGKSKEFVVKLMLKFGLISRLLRRKGTKFEISYLIPSLLPNFHFSSASNKEGMAIEWPLGSFRTFYFCFSTSDFFEKQGAFTWGDLKSRGFSPFGLFERLICKLVNHSQLTLDLEATDFNISSITKDVALLIYGNQEFQLRNLVDMNCIRVDVRGNNPIAIYRRLKEQLTNVREECMKSLREFSTVLVTRGTDAFHVTHDQLDRTLASSRPVNLGHQSSLSSVELKSMFPEWLSANKPLSRYDIFLSYRWSKFDSAFVQILFDRFSLYTVDSISKRCIDSFWDNKRLPDGLNFQEAFGSALVNSMLITPIISQNTLERMVGARFDPSKEDNVLVEWILSLECLRHTGTPLTRVRAICPVIMGKYDDKSGVFSSLFDDQAFLDQMSSKVPFQSLAVVKHLLQKNNIPVDPVDDARLSSYTVRSVVLSMTKMNFIVVDKSFEYSSIFVAVSEKLKRCLEGFIEQDNSNLTYNLHSLSPEVAVGGGGMSPPLPALAASRGQPSWEAAFVLITAPKNATIGKEADLSSLLVTIGIESVDDMPYVSKNNLLLLADLLKDAKKSQFLLHCGLQ